NDEAAELSGVPTGRISLIVWALSGLLAGIAAILAGPTKPILSVALGGGGGAILSSSSNLLLRGLGAAMIGGLTNMPQVFAAGLVTVLLVAVVLPLPAGRPQLVLYSAVCVFAMIALSLVILTGWAGQVSLGHFTFVAFGAFVGGRLHQLGYPSFGSIGLTLLFAAIVSVVVGLPALRIRGLFLAVTTLAFAV